MQISDVRDGSARLTCGLIATVPSDDGVLGSRLLRCLGLLAWHILLEGGMVRMNDHD